MTAEVNNEVPTLAERMEALNEGDILLDSDYLHQVVFPQILASCLGLVIIYTATLVLADKYAPKGTDLAKKRKLCYQFTNLCANAVLSGAGIYFQYWRLPDQVTEEESTQGFQEFIFMSCFQMGFQFWAIPVGVLHVNESMAMLAHHITVISVSAMSGFLRNGFRYWTPFFYGVIEVSSIPLSAMNFFKDNPAYIKKYPKLFNITRTVFGCVFVFVRVYLFVPRLYFYLRDGYLLFSTHPFLPYRVFMATAWMSSFFLLLLQIYWATLIIKGGVKAMFGAKKKKQKSK